jgi:hypothetical protein
MRTEDDDAELLNDSNLIRPSTMRSWCENPAYVEAAEEGADKWLKRPLNADAVLAGIRFLHKFVDTPDGQRAVKQAFDEGFVQMVPGEGDDTRVYVIPRLIWRDRFYDDLAPGHGTSASMGIQFARYMLWGPPGFIERAMRRKGGTPWDPAVRKAIRCFKAEQKQRQQKLAGAITAAVRELAERAAREQGGGEGMLAISGRAIFEHVRWTIPDATFAEVSEETKRNVRYVGPGH